MKRRHQIVHEGDMPRKGEDTSKRWSRIEGCRIAVWAISVRCFLEQLAVTAEPNPQGQRVLKDLRKAHGLLHQVMDNFEAALRKPQLAGGLIDEAMERSEEHTSELQ